jgi:phosphoadenosine phosphosulfate reductase
MTESLTTNSGIIQFNESQLKHWNDHLQKLQSPEEIIKWAIVTFKNIYQISALGISGLSIIHLLSEKFAEEKIDCIFIDTLHHFPQTLDLVEKIQQKYYGKDSVSDFHIVKPLGLDSEKEFSAKYGDNLWISDDDKYDYYSKVEPLERTYKSFNIDLVITGRRQTQGNDRANLDILEYDALNKVLKLNPFYNHTFKQVHEIVVKGNVPTNELLEYGYKSIGDYHSTLPTVGDDERGGRWSDKKGKTECGIHQPERFSKFK